MGPDPRGVEPGERRGTTTVQLTKRSNTFLPHSSTAFTLDVTPTAARTRPPRSEPASGTRLRLTAPAAAPLLPYETSTHHAAFSAELRSMGWPMGGLGPLEHHMRRLLWRCGRVLSRAPKGTGVRAVYGLLRALTAVL